MWPWPLVKVLFPLLFFAWRFLHLTGLFCWSLLPNWTFTSKNIQGSVWGPLLCHLPAAAVNTSRPKLPSASLYFRCLLWTPSLYIPLPMWCLDWQTSQASQLQCSHRTYIYTCVRAHTQSYSFSITSCFSKWHHHLFSSSRHLHVLLDSLLPPIRTVNIHQRMVFCVSWCCLPLSSYTAKPPGALIWTIALISWPASNFCPSQSFLPRAVKRPLKIQFWPSTLFLL